jgi:hypothetical protein
VRSQRATRNINSTRFGIYKWAKIIIKGFMIVCYLPPPSAACLRNTQVLYLHLAELYSLLTCTPCLLVLPAYLYSLLTCTPYLHLYCLRVVFIHALSICLNFIRKGYSGIVGIAGLQRAFNACSMLSTLLTGKSQATIFRNCSTFC